MDDKPAELKPDLSDFYMTYAIHTRKPVYSPDDLSVLVCIPACVDMRGNVAPDTLYLSLVVVPAEIPVLSIDRYLDYVYKDFQIVSHQQVGSMRRVCNNG